MDLKARKVTIPFNGGSVTGTIGLLEAVFGEQLVADQQGKLTAVARRAHSRRRVIGGPSESVAAASYNLTSYGARGNGPASGGEPIQVFYAGDWWTMRLTGSHTAFDGFLKQGGFAGGKVVLWRSEKGTKYGPYQSQQPDGVLV